MDLQSGLLIFVILHIISTVYGQLSINFMLTPMCTARCLNIFRTRKGFDSNSTAEYKPYNMLEYCQGDEECKGCIDPCNEHKPDLQICQTYCNTNIALDLARAACHDSCRFLATSRRVRPGICQSGTPSLDLPPLRISRCSYACHNDLGCPKAGHKCCISKDGCGQQCELAHLPGLDVPPIPKGIVVRKFHTGNESIIDLVWTSYDLSAVPYPVVFVVQLRKGSVNKAGTDVHGIWRDILTTTKTGMILSGIKFVSWFQFRVIAFNSRGVAGYSPATAPITVDYRETIGQPRPAIPSNITELKSSIIGESVSVTISWMVALPDNLALPITEYRISWRKLYQENENNLPVKEFDIRIPGSQATYTIEKLEPSTTYQVIIISVINYRNERYNSTPSMQYISTPALPDPKWATKESSKLQDTVQQNLPTSGCICDITNDLLPVEVNQFRMIHGQLTAQLTLKDSVEISNDYSPYVFRLLWKPLACINAKNPSPIHEFVNGSGAMNFTGTIINRRISGLRYRCNYRLELQLFSEFLKRVMKIWQGCFCTPICAVQLTSGSREECFKTEDRLPPQPRDLQVTLRPISNNRSLAKVSWAATPIPVSAQWPLGPPIGQPRFRVTWGPRVPEPLEITAYSSEMQPLLDSNRAISSVVKWPVREIILSDLEPDLIYIVKIQTLHDEVVSRDSILFFKVKSDNAASTSPKCISIPKSLLIFSIFLLLWTYHPLP